MAMLRGKAKPPIRLADRRIALLADLSGLRRVEQFGAGTWIGVASDRSLLTTRDTGTGNLRARREVAVNLRILRCFANQGLS
jgi:hypothetical protein